MKLLALALLATAAALLLLWRVVRELSTPERLPCSVCGARDSFEHGWSWTWLTKEDADDFYPALSDRVPARGAMVRRCAFGLRLESEVAA